MLLQAFFSIRSERQLTERLGFDLLFRWFVGIGLDDAAWDPSVFFQEPRAPVGRRRRSQAVSSAGLAQPRVKLLLSNDHFSVDAR
jgi:hypothetical protein